MLDLQKEYEEKKRREKEFEMRNGEIGKMLWGILQKPFIDWLYVQGYLDEDGDDADLLKPDAPFPAMKADFDGLTLTVRHGYDIGTIYMNTVEGRYVKLRRVVINVFSPEGDDRESFGFGAMIDEDTGEYDIFSCMVDRYGQMHAAICELKPDDRWHASLRKAWNKFYQWLLRAFTAHKLGHDDYKLTNVRET